MVFYIDFLSVSKIQMNKIEAAQVYDFSAMLRQAHASTGSCFDRLMLRQAQHDSNTTGSPPKAGDPVETEKPSRSYCRNSNLKAAYHSPFSAHITLVSLLMHLHQWIGIMKNTSRIEGPNPCMLEPQTKSGVVLPHIIRTGKTFRRRIG